ncbi:basic amino acid/polyamine antiporter, APA family [Lishizhenia tianjinensis]|uniref:Basic amino acid/polyamine antiporter, APA family n=1 Tax=Lishizhenia tianjinensis TaxID=477690 RepID=A0A1I7ADY3_9FLAO|nr:APC family permease [Lishizhenia tianjinensis]SFT73151.1 basic amino acid/polyamine antiporter, APA family [Lishizhenia tianjinensis]
MAKLKQNSAKKISVFGLTMVVVGACIGSGIFLSPQSVANYIGEENHILWAWLIGGGVAFCGALTYSELVGLFPKAGGIYVFLKETYGKRMAFLYGWIVLSVITSGSIAALVIASSSYLNTLLGSPFSQQEVIIIALLMIAFNTLIHVRGIKLGEIFINILSVLKIVGIFLLIAAGLYFINREAGEIAPTPEVAKSSSDLWIGVALSMIPVMWSFGGFQHASFLAADAKNPKKSVPLSMLIGVAFVTLCYWLCNYTYIQVLGVEGLMSSTKPAVDTMNLILDQGGTLVSLLIVISTFGSAFIFTMSAPRIYYAMSKDQVFFKWTAKRHKKYDTPANAIMVQSFWSAVLLVFWGSFENLINYVTFIEWIFLLLAGLGVFYFRRVKDKKDYSFRIPLGPIIPAVFALVVIGFLVAVLSDGNKPALYGCILLAVGLLVYEIFKRKNRSEISNK